MTADKNEGPFRYLTSIKDADCDPVVGIVRRASVARARTRESNLGHQKNLVVLLSVAPLRRTQTMIRLTTALLTLGVSVATATTALAQGCFYGACNPEATWCRVLCGSDPQQQNVRSQWAPGYVAAPHERSMYMAHGSTVHKKKAPQKKEP
jgi:hypothetical protein